MNFLTLSKPENKQKFDVPYFIKPLKKYPHFGLEVYGGVGFLNKTLTAKNPELASFVNTKEQAEKNLDYVRFGVSVSYQFHPNIKFTTGIEHLVIHELFNGQQDSSKVFLERNNTTTYRAVTEISTRTVKHYNTYTQLNIPLSLAYTNQWKRLRYDIYGGLNWNFYSQVKGKSYDTDLNIIELSASDFYKNRKAFSYFIGLKVGYPIRKNLYLNARLRYDQFFNNIINSKAVFNQKYQLLGLQIGVEYLLE